MGGRWPRLYLPRIMQGYGIGRRTGVGGGLDVR